MNVIKQNISDTLEINYMPYAMSVIVSRALPEIDGFKPSHRKLLYTMYKMGLLKQSRTKSANIVGQTMKLNPHGDSAIYETMVRLTKGYDALNVPYVNSKGNFGKVYSKDMAYAAARYTEAKLSDICETLFSDIEEESVDFVDNYDGKMKEPVLLPSRFPNILVNANQGIAVGMASNICGFNLGEVCDGTIGFLSEGDKFDISQYIKAPDFSTGGELIYNQAEMRHILKSGKGSFKVRATYKIIKSENCIEISQIPYTTTIEAIIDKIEDLVKSGKVREINDVRDETDLNGLKLTIDLKRGVNADVLMQKLFVMTPLQDSFSCNFNILIDGHPVVLGVQDILKEWCSFRKNCIIKKYKFNINKLEKRQHLLLGLSYILLDIDKAIALIRNSEKESDVIPALMKNFSITNLQADFIAEIKLRNLNKQYILKSIKETKELEKEIKKLQGIINSEEKLKKVIIDDLREIKKKYDTPRKTKLLLDSEEVLVQTHHLTPEYRVKIFLTKEQYFKKISLASLRSAAEHRLKENDEIILEIEASNKTELLFFSNKARVYKLKMYDIEDVKASQLGVYLPNLLGLDEDERIIYVYPTLDYNATVLIGFKNGYVAKIPLSLYVTKTNRKKLVNAYYSKSPCVGIIVLKENETACALREDGKKEYFKNNDIEFVQKRDSQGVKVISVTKKYCMQKLYALDRDQVK
ncbi:topoisomerase IV [Candidatus Epulonipiscioides gigas]|nr:topoisomerase IV [Epulopiscium sp. SCG-C07WGA-EpuloA2]